jgi:hypothetical protein
LDFAEPNRTRSTLAVTQVLFWVEVAAMFSAELSGEKNVAHCGAAVEE